MLTETEKQTLIEKIEVLPAQLSSLVQNLSQAQLTTAYLAQEWTVAQNVHHLADSHMNSFIRLKLILTEDKPPLKPYDQEAWADLADGNGADIEISLTLLRGLHQRWGKLFRSLDGPAWAQTGMHPEVGEVTPLDLLASYAQHGEDHLDQIQRTLAAGGF